MPSNPIHNQRRSLTLIFIIMMMDVIGITLLMPVAPTIILRYSSSAIMVTMVSVVYAGGQFIASPILGKFGDRFGRRPVLLVSLLGQAAGYFMFYLGGSLWMLLLGRLVGGITSGNLSTSNAYIVDVSKPEERAKNFGIPNVAWSLGLILGPALGGIFGQLSLETPALIAGLITLVNTVMCYFLLPESLPVEKREKRPMQLNDYNPIASIFGMARRPVLGVLLLVIALFSFAFNGISSTTPLFMIQKFSAVTWQLSVMMILSGITVAISNGILVPRWTPRFGVKVVGIGSLIGIAVFSVGVFAMPLFWLAVIVNMLSSSMNVFIFPSLTTLSADCVAPHEVGQLLGVNTAVNSLMNILGPLWAGTVYDYVMPGAPLWMGSLVLLASAWLLSRARTPAHKPAPAAA